MALLLALAVMVVQALIGGFLLMLTVGMAHEGPLP